MSQERNQDWNDAFGDPRAAEYVLGTLPADERAAFAEAVENDRTLADKVDVWAARLAPLNHVYGEIKPPTSIKTALDRRLFSSSAVQSRRSEQPARRWWPFIGGLASGLAAAVVILLALPVFDSSLVPPSGDQPVQTEADGRMVASLSPTESEAGFVALWENQSRTLNLTRVSGGLPSEGVYEIWVIHDGSDPVSLGVLPEDEVAHMVMPKAHADMMTRDATLAVSMEPEGGSPTGLPTGPVVAAGHVHGI
ncbi:anti-sigma factor [Notoacmeibacter ruber]|uniref:Anti-sigma factor n=1 Tax=Notoacmeibacter ruber TaxID=2670375 RepID=A0A3L7J8K6_9HYPH|nr:anti-sigma factor [Notoacmeibacter ruber]RLQ87068.1 anti-sigma factor [Notoacmeibacter ruber]